MVQKIKHSHIQGTPWCIVVRSNDLHPLSKPSSMRLPTSTSKSLWRGRINTPLTTFYKWFTLLQIFKEKEGGEHSSYWKQKLAKDFAKTFISISCFSKVVFSIENWGVFIGPKRIQIWAPNFEFSWVSEAGGATACQCLTLTMDWRCHRPAKRCHHPALGCWAVPPLSSWVLGGATA